MNAHDRSLLIKNTLIQFTFMLNCLVGTLMTFFLKFHIYLVSNNKTTIENLDKAKSQHKSLYDVGPLHNWYQVFGTNVWMWPFPVQLGSGKPTGDGIYWPSN